MTRIVVILFYMSSYRTKCIKSGSGCPQGIKPSRGCDKRHNLDIMINGTVLLIFTIPVILISQRLKQTLLGPFRGSIVKVILLATIKSLDRTKPSYQFIIEN